jgi:hypothetical protein
MVRLCVRAAGLAAALAAITGALFVGAPARAAMVGSGTTSTGIYAPLDAASPPLTVPAAALSAALTCNGNLAEGPRPVLLVHGTALEPGPNFSWNYELGLTASGRPWCAVSLPNNAMSDAQISAQYVVSAIRAMHAASGQPINILGYSQGGMLPRWALRFYPDTRAMVKNLVAIDPSNHGTLDAVGICVPGCAASFWQQRTASNFLTALNSGAETFPGINYTVIYSDTDEVVVPNIAPVASSSLHTGNGLIENIAVQSICPLDVSEHLLMGTVDPVAYALAMNAFTHDSVANPAQVPASTCLSGLAPDVDPLTFAGNFTTLTLYIAHSIATAPLVSAEPSLDSYVFAH